MVLPQCSIQQYFLAVLHDSAVQLRVASKINDSKTNEVLDSKIKAREQLLEVGQVQEVQEQVQEVHDSQIKVQQQVQEVQEQVRDVHDLRIKAQEVHDSKIKVQEHIQQVQEQEVPQIKVQEQLQEVREQFQEVHQELVQEVHEQSAVQKSRSRNRSRRSTPRVQYVQ